ncbi:hypothetical protein [Hymenobacter tenuis]
MADTPGANYYASVLAPYGKDMGVYPDANILAYYDTDNRFKVAKSAAGKVNNWIDRSGNGWHLSTAATKEASILTDTDGREVISFPGISGSLVGLLAANTNTLVNPPYTVVALMRKAADFGTVDKNVIAFSGGGGPFMYMNTFLGTHFNSGYATMGNTAYLWELSIASMANGNSKFYKTNANGTPGTVQSPGITGIYNFSGVNLGAGKVHQRLFMVYTRAFTPTEMLALRDQIAQQNGLTL